MTLSDFIVDRSGHRSAMRYVILYQVTRLGDRVRAVMAALVSVAMLTSPTVAAKPSEHSYSLIRIYKPRIGTKERDRILGVAMAGEIRDRRQGPGEKVLALRAAKLMDPQIWETEDWSIAFLRYRSSGSDGGAVVRYAIFSGNEAGEWRLRWSLNEGGHSRSCDELFDHLIEARKFIAHRGLDPKRLAPELFVLERIFELTMREYKGVCSGDF